MRHGESIQLQNILRELPTRHADCCVTVLWGVRAVKNPTSRILPAIAASVVCGLTVACSHPPAGQVQPDPPKAADQYLIGAGDMLQVFVWRNPELSATVPVRPDGNISTPLVDSMIAVGKTPIQLARDMEAVLAEYVRSPKVNIIVTTAASAFSLVKVVGQVAHPQALPYREGMTVLDAILAVGGLGQFASGNRARIVRVEHGQQTTIHVKL